MSATIYIYIPVIIPVRRWSQWGGLGWGGVGMMTFLAPERIFDATEMMSFLSHEHIFDATEMMSFLAHEHIFDATENWGGLGWGWWRSLHLNTSLMLRRWCGSLHMLRRWCRSLHMNTSLMLRRTGVGWGGVDHWRSENFAGACKQKRQFAETIQTQVLRGRWWQPCRE